MRPALAAAQSAAAVAQIQELAGSRPPTLGSGRLVCVDGPAGSGKTTLARSLARSLAQSLAQSLVGPTVHMDDLYPGWEGLERIEPEVLGLLEPLSRDRPGHYRRWDWLTSARAERHQLDPSALLVLEGVGSGSRAWAQWCTVLVWVEADPETRLRRGIARDGEAVRERWIGWTADEQRHFAREQTRLRADLVFQT